MNEIVSTFKPDDITIKLGDGDNAKEYRIFYDLNAFAELEKMYDSIDSILQMLLSTKDTQTVTNVTYMKGTVNATDIEVDGIPLTAYIAKASRVKEAKLTDTLNLLWAGCLHDCAIYNNFGEITGYTVTKARLGACVTLKNLPEVNSKILIAFLRDLIPSNEAKNAEVPV